ncbi:MAG: class I SAM-dependent methyltransferase [Chloroflexota bacterium]
MNISLLEAANWKDYEFLDSGDGLKLERYGPYRFVRPEAQAIWKRSLSAAAWNDVHGVFQPTNEESGGHWSLRKQVDEKWVMNYAGIKFWTMTTPGRHLGVFPEVASHWDWYSDLITEARRPIRVLNLFGYTGLASLMAAKAGAQVTHLDASKKSVTWARDNQVLSGLSEKPIRWIVDDALAFVDREGRRGVKYDGIILDPPKFGRGPKGEIWEVYQSLPLLLESCKKIISDTPLFMALTMYAVRSSAIHLAQSLDELMDKHHGKIDAGELVSKEKSAGRFLSHAVYARWQF